jgi:hypothetical protein
MNLKFVARFAGCVLLAGSFAGSASAANWPFELHNKSRSEVVSFWTQEDGKWSDDWLGDEMVAPGETYEMDFNTDEGECEVRTRITFGDDTYVDTKIDYCEVSNIYVNKNNVTFD